MNKGEEKQVPGNANSENSSKGKSRVRGRKRKRQDSESSSEIEDSLPENTLETEKNLQALAIKNNLDDVSVKKILKKVVTNDHVLALVKMREEEENSGTEHGISPKLTRAKAKELRKVSSGTAWHHLELTPIKHIPVKTRPEVTALIAQELPEDEDDDEYEPIHDDSDDDVTCSDLDSQPRTPATPASQKKESPAVVKDGPFKVPQEVSVTVRRKLELEEEATIALRTRSKLSLSETPIEHIESSFIPPDDLPMPDVDDLWNEFLNECLNPESKANEEDDELDPEYNVAADPDANEEDEEALEKSIIKISKKELNDLVNELMNVMPEGVENQLISNIQGEQNQTNTGGVETRILDPTNKTDVVQTQWEGKQEPLSDDECQTTGVAARITFERSSTVARVSIGKTEIEDADEHAPDKDSTQETATVDSDKVLKTEVPTTASSDVPTITSRRTVTISVEERELPVAEARQPSLKPPPPLLKLVAPPPLTVNIEVDNNVQMSPEQVSILKQQLRQHIQLSTSNFLQLFVHPIHWSFAPKYKGYLETFEKIARENPKSVVNVCNLIPAVELIRSWESSVSENTEDNKKMVEFIQGEVEKCRRRCAANNLYLGDFPELFKKVIANSTVFLYPHMLPPVPYRAVNNRRFSYMKSEDALIVLGLDQFWWYVENNPNIFKPPQKLHPRRRWGLMITVGLVCKHMLPWVSPKALLGHIQCVRKSEDKSNPIVKYFEDKTIDPVRHTILPFNPKLTLYEHPEIEMPKLWIRYLSINSRRFKRYANRRSSAVKAPQGIEIQVGKAHEPIQKEALPIDFIKPISSNRINVLPKTPKPNFVDKVDVHINTTTSDNVPDTSFLIAKNLYTIVSTSVGKKLVPLQLLQTNTVNTANTPICSTTASDVNVEGDEALEAYNSIEDNTKIAEISTKRNCIVITPGNALNAIDKLKHCPCCILLRKICKIRQSRIMEYFKPNRERDKDCECTNRKYPRITNKLKLLVNNYKTRSNVLYTGLLEKLKEKPDLRNNMKDESSDFSFKDFASALSYQTKLLIRTGVIRNNTVKNCVYTAFSKFNVDSGDPLQLAEKLLKIFHVDLADMYKEFLGFLTAEQAAAIGHFKEYFIGNCVEDLLKKVEEQIQDVTKRREIYRRIERLFVCAASSSPCDVCCELLSALDDCPALARYVFQLFPHRRKQETRRQSANNQETISTSGINTSVREDIESVCGQTKSACEVTRNGCEVSAVTMDYEADDSCSEDDMELAVDEDIDEPSNENRDPDDVITVRREDNQVLTTERREDNQVLTTERREDNQILTAERREDNQILTAERREENQVLTTERREENQVLTKRREDSVDEGRVQLVTTIKYEPIDTCELTVTKTEVQENSETDMSRLIMSEDESIKSEPLEWTRDEDKLILELLKQYLTPEERSDKTIIEIIKEKDLLNIITNRLCHKSLEDVTERVLYLLQILILSDYDNGK